MENTLAKTKKKPRLPAPAFRRRRNVKPVQPEVPVPGARERRPIHSPVMPDEETRAVLYCVKCKRPMAGKPHGSYETMSPGGSYWAVVSTLMECIGCNSPFVVQSSSPALDDFGCHSDEAWTLPEQVLPPIDEAMDDAVPAVISKNYLEARRCLRGQNHTAAVVMCRRTLEFICNHFNADGSDLFTMLKSLRLRLILDDRMHSWGDNIIRFMGNKGAHAYVDDITPEDAADAVEFTKAFILYLFVFDAAFHEHMKRRPAKV